MADLDSIEEVLEFAIAREIEAYELYMYIAQRLETSVMRKICEDFAAMELAHKARLELELIKAGKVVSGEGKAVLNIADYMEDTGSPIDMNYKELFVFAIKKEETSVRFYSDLANAVGDRETREALLELAEQENQHRLRFEIEFDSVKNE